MPVQGRTVIPALVGTVASLFQALVLWYYVFSFSGVWFAPGFATSEAATPAAVDAGGRYRWPGTTVRVLKVNPQRVCAF